MREIAEALEEAFFSAYRRRRLPTGLVEELLDRHPSALEGVALRLRQQREADEAEQERAQDPELMREWARARAERTRCIDECMQEEDTCTGWRQRLFVGPGGALVLRRERVQSACGMRLEDCQMMCGIDERDPEWAGED